MLLPSKSGSSLMLSCTLLADLIFAGTIMRQCLGKWTHCDKECVVTAYVIRKSSQNKSCLFQRVFTTKLFLRWVLFSAYKTVLYKLCICMYMQSFGQIIPPLLFLSLYQCRMKADLYLVSDTAYKASCSTYLPLSFQFCVKLYPERQSTCANRVNSVKFSTSDVM